MTSSVDRPRFTFHSDDGPSSKASRITWTLPKCCSKEEGEAISQALELLNTRLRDHPELLLRIKINIQKCTSAEEVYTEIASLAYLAKDDFKQSANQPFFSDILKFQIEEQLEALITRHYQACWPHIMKIPAGSMHYLLSLISQLLITDDPAISKMGIACVRTLLTNSKIPFYLEPQYYKHLLLVLDQFQKNSFFLSRSINVHQSLHKFCRIDLKFPENRELSLLDFKRWVVQMFFADIVQPDTERNCCAISALKFSIANGFEDLLNLVLSLLDSGYFYLNRQVHFDIASLMQGQCIRSEDLSADIKQMSSFPPVLEEIVDAYRLNGIESDLSLGSLLSNPHLQSIYSSYIRNVLQTILLHCSQLGAVNGSVCFSNDPRDLRDPFIRALVSAFIETNELETLYGKILYNIFSNSVWLWDANPGTVSLGEGTFTIDQATYPYTGSNPDRLQRLFLHARRIVVVKGRNTIVVNEFTELVRHLQELIPRDYREVIFSQHPDPLRWCERLKERFLPFIDVEGFTSEDFGDLCCLSQSGGNVSDALTALGQVAFMEVSIPSPSPMEYLESAKTILPPLPPSTFVILRSRKHAFTTDVAKLQSVACDVRPAEPIAMEETAISLSNVKLLPEQTFTLTDIQAKIPEVFKRLGVTLDARACQRIIEPYSNTDNYTLRYWANYLRNALIAARLRILEPEMVESALRAEYGLPAIFCVGDVNWMYPWTRTHCMLKVIDGEVFHLYGGELYYNCFEFSRGQIYYPLSYRLASPIS